MRKGFTLIELMIVVVIIGILAAIAIPNFVKIIDKAKESSVKANMHTLQVTVETINVDRGGVYPGNTETTDIEDELPDNFTNPYGTSLTTLVVGSNAGTQETSGIVCYVADTDEDATSYTITGRGKEDTVDLVLIPGSN